MPVALVLVSDDLAIQDLQGSEQGRGSGLLVIVYHRCGLSVLHRQALPRPPERLNLRLLVNRQHHRPIRRFHVQPHDIAGLFLQSPDRSRP